MSGLLMVDGAWPVLKDGLPVAGATISFFEAGTTTPKLIYSNDSLGTSLGAVLTTNADGVPQTLSGTIARVWWGSGQYDVKIDVSGNIRVWENIHVISFNTESVASYDAANPDSAKEQFEAAISLNAGKGVSFKGLWAFGSDRLVIDENYTAIDLSGAQLTFSGHIDSPALNITGNGNTIKGGIIVNTEITTPAATQYNAALWITGTGNIVTETKAFGVFYVAFVDGNVNTGQSADRNHITNCYAEGYYNRGFYAYCNISGASFINCEANGYGAAAGYNQYGVGSGLKTRRGSYGGNFNRSATSYVLSNIDIHGFTAYGHTAHNLFISGQSINASGLNLRDLPDSGTFQLIIREIPDVVTKLVNVTNVLIDGGFVGVHVINADKINISNVHTTNTKGAACQLLGVSDVKLQNCHFEKGSNGAGDGLQITESAASGTLPARGSTDVVMNNLSSKDWGSGRVPIRISGTGTAGIMGYGLKTKGAQYSVIVDSPATYINLKGDFKYDTSAPSGATANVVFVQESGL